ncbi:MAG TPA: hypothetical protein VFW83_04610, partial [Bryobacteraceae bacterium]|nr:hypothetical protein [Bryobacteraceae bacterium]
IAMGIEASGSEFAARSHRNKLTCACFDHVAAGDQALQLGFKLGASKSAPRKLPQQLLKGGAAVRQITDVV